MKRLMVLAVGLAGVLPTLARAAEDAGKEAGGLPQFGPTYFPSQIFWLIVFFALLYWLFTRKALPRLQEILEERQDRIAADLDRAAELRREAEEAYARYERMLEDARARAHQTLVEAQERIARETAERVAELERTTQARIREAEAEIARARAQALAELDEAAAEVVRLASERLAGVELAAEEARAAVARVRERGEARR